MGSVTVPITVNQKTIQWKMLIIDQLAEECILGADFMSKNPMTIDMGAKTSSFNSDHLKSLTSKTISPCNRTFLQENHHAKFRCQISCQDNTTLCPGSLVITKRTEIMEGVFLEEAITKVMRRNVIFVIATNTNPYPVFLKPIQTIGEVTDTSAIQVIPVDEAKICSFGNPAKTGQIPPASPEKLAYLKENFNCPMDTPTDIRAQYEALILQNHDVFAQDKFDLGFSDKVSHRINMKNQLPVYVKQFRIPDTYEKEIVSHVKEWVRQGVVEECSSPYNSPVFCVPKKDGGLRIVQDLRQLNKNSHEDKYAIKDVQECVDVIGKSNSRIFSTMDMASGFWQQNLETDSRDYTAFTIPLLNTQFRWKRTVMGLAGASSSFSRLTALVFRGIEKAITYIDDLLTHSQTHKEQLTILQQCFDRMRNFNMKFNIKKCVFGAQSVTYLGYQISEEGISPANDKVLAVKSIQPPTTMKEVRAFVGFCNYFRRMVPNFSRLAGPLIAMTKLTAGWKSGPLPQEALQSFSNMKQALSSRPVIAHSRTGGQYILTVDAATTGLGAILSQVNQGEETIVSYWSRTVRDHERNYTPYMLEMTAVCSALEHFHENVFGKKVIIYTDHRPLLGASTMQKKTINRLVENMNIYNIDLRYKKGVENQGADFLSRNAILSISQEDRFEDIRVHQRNDPITNGISSFLQMGTLPKEDKIRRIITSLAPRCFIKNDILWIVPPRAPTAVLFTPKDMTQTVIKNAHGTPMSGHWAAARTIHRIGESYFWHTMGQEVSEFIKNCNQCQRAQRPPKNAELTPWPPCHKPNERVHIDLFGPLQGDSKHKYVAVITCAFTNWTEVTPIANKEAITVAKAVFEEWICRRGTMQQLVSDGGKEFANSLLDELCKLMSINKHVVTPYHPMSNGQAERFNKDMKKYLRTILTDTTNWAAYLKPLQFAHNSALNKSTNFTPHFLTFLENPRMPDSISTPDSANSSSYSADAIQRLHYTFDLVYSNNKKARETYTLHFNKRARARLFQVGDEILASFPVHQNIPNKKLASIWKGPFVVVEINDNNIITIKASPKHKPIRLHVNRVVLFNHLADKTTEEATHTEAPSTQPPTPISTTEEEEDDNIFNLGPIHTQIQQQPVGPPIPPLILHRQAGQWVRAENPQILPPPVIPAAQEAPQQLGPLDQLAREIFRHTRSRGPVAQLQATPQRPLEYKPVPKRK